MTQSSRPAELPLRKRLLFGLLALTLFLGVLELGLWAAGVDPASRDEDPFVGFASNLRLFTKQVDEHGVSVWSTAENKSAFFNFQQFPQEKSPDTFRVFCLGGSTTYGRPYSDPTSFAGWLRAFLPEADPSRRWEVVNAGGISYASYRVAALMEELATYEPDLFVVYTGHNEFLEERTYRDIRRLPAPVRVAMGALSRTRTWTAATRVLHRRADEAASNGDERSILAPEVQAKLDRSAGPASYERDDELAGRINDHYRISLERIVSTARDAGAEVLLVTPASNLKDCTPFKSEPTPDLDAGSAARAAALAARSGGEQAPEALATLDSALALDPRNADLLFARGRALLAAGRIDEARASFEAARDEDICPLRALGEMQEAVRQTAGRLQVPLVDFARIVDEETLERTGQPIPGEELFLDHVHPTIEGHRILALALLDEMSRQEWVDPDATWNADAIEQVTRRVEDGVDPAAHAQALANLSVTLNWAGKNEESRRLALRALESGQEDATMLMMVARHAALDGQAEQAHGYFRRAVRASPNSPVVHSQLGMFYSGQGDHEAAAAHFFLAGLLWDDNDVYQKQLASTLQQLGHRRAALRALLRAAELNPADAELPARIERLRSTLPAGEPAPVSAGLSVTRHDSGFPSTVGQTSPQPDGDAVLDGVWTSWYEDGSLRGFACYRAGALEGPVASWSPDGLRQP
jgi:tetratricopeptide (TPR) repeat protein